MWFKDGFPADVAITARFELQRAAYHIDVNTRLPFALFPHLTVRKNIEYGLDHLSKLDRRRISDEMMGLFEITDLADRRPREISGCQAQRVALAKAVAPQPRILLLDEPLAALDVPTRARLCTELRRLLEQIPIPSLVVTHDRTEAISLGHQIVVMARKTRSDKSAA